MEWDTVFKIVTASTASVGVGGVIVWGLSTWIGKVWATHILEKERHKFSEELEKTKKELEVIKETTLRFQNDKILAYRSVVDVVVKILSLFDMIKTGRLPTQEGFDVLVKEFNEQRLRVYGYLAMMAPQSVMDSQDQLMDHLLDIANGDDKYDWERVRELAIAFLNTVRIDIGIDKTAIMYKGKR